MADLTDGDSDLRNEEVKKEEEKPSTELKPETEAEEAGPTVGPEDSEYETLEEDNDVDDSPRRDAEYKEEFDEERSESEGSRRDDDSEGSLSGEETDRESKDAEVGQRQEGDGQESNKDKKLDHDEDRRDPQYIPKKGIFYEHDDRTNDDLEEEGETKTEDTTAKKGRVWKEPTDKWEHDLFNEGDQAPKSTQELLDLYGYDIRNEDSAPKARRRRRYGRGPTKYTRNWEDETAYSKKRGGGRGGGFVNRKEDFPSLEAPPRSGGSPMRGGRSPRGRGKPVNEDWSPPRTIHITSKMRSEKSEATATPLGDRTERIQGRGRSAPRRMEGRGRPSQHERAATKPSTPPFKSKGETDEEDIAALSKQFSDAVINIARDGTTSLPIRGSSAPPSDKPASGVVESHQPLPQQHQQVQQQQSQQGRSGSEGAEGAGGRSKRYSTQRQRSLPQPTVQQQYIQQPQQYFQQQPPQIHSGFPAAGRGVYPGEEAPAMVAFLPPGGGPPTYPPPPPPPAAIINYVPSPHQFHHAPIPMPPPPAGPAEVYTGQGGITYYSTQNQLARPSNVSRRVKLAIPIVPPPDQQSHDTLTT